MVGMPSVALGRAEVTLHTLAAGDSAHCDSGAVTFLKAFKLAGAAADGPSEIRAAAARPNWTLKHLLESAPPPSPEEAGRAADVAKSTWHIRYDHHHHADAIPLAITHALHLNTSEHRRSEPDLAAALSHMQLYAAELLYPLLALSHLATVTWLRALSALDHAALQ